MIPLLILISLFITLMIFYENRDFIRENMRISFKVYQVMKSIPGPPSLPLLGSSYLFKWNVKDFTYQVEEWGRKYVLENPEKSGGLMKIWMGPVPLVAASLPAAVKVILESNTCITKPRQYDILGRFLGWGILLSTGERWHARRKLLTPAFHFNILRGYIPVFAEQGEVLLNELDVHADLEEVVDVFPLIRRCGLDIIAETAMGIRLGTQIHENSDYINAVTRIQQIIWDFQRFPWLWISPIWWLSGYKKEFDRHCQFTQQFTRKVIASRKEILEEEGLLGKKDRITLEEVQKQKLPLLDLLLMMREADALEDEDIRMEVDTFMFEGSDTNSVNMGFTLWFIGQNEEVQAKLHQELDSVFGDSTCQPTEENIRNLPYLERCIKQWERPEEYWPDHFLPEKQANRDPYAFIPFSAGPRNCIGQKFAMMEAKCILAQLFRRFRVETIEKWPGNRPLPEIILKPSNGFKVKLYRR